MQKLIYFSKSSVLLLLSAFISNSAFAANSIELMCKSKAKEIAADVYSSCVTEAKQTQLKSLRKEYEEKLTQLKSHYDKELKKISTGQAGSTKVESSAPQTESRSLESKQASSSDKFIKRSSGARELPERTNTLDNNTDVNSVEVVEIPAEQE